MGLRSGGLASGLLVVGAGRPARQDKGESWCSDPFPQQLSF
jgi:hypothetical protein